MARCIIHIGMHKTGTSSIQQSLNGFEDSSFFYANIYGHPNHSAALRQIFSHEQSHRGDAVLIKKAARGDIATFGDAFEKTIREAGDRTLIISGEGISFFSERELESLYRYLSKYFSNINVVAAVRAPAGYMASSFQEPIKHGTQDFLKLETRYRSYKDTFLKFDEVFGRENVTLWKFEPKAFPGGCAVHDFCQRFGINLPEERILRVNESVSLEAMSLLFIYRKYGQSFGSMEMTWQQNKGLINQLMDLGETKFRFSPEAIIPILKKNQEDISWMEGRLGLSLEEDLGPPLVTDVSSEQDLERVRPETLAKLVNKLGELAPGNVSEMAFDDVAGLVHSLRRLGHTDRSQEGPEQMPYVLKKSSEALLEGGQIEIIKLIAAAKINGPELLRDIGPKNASDLVKCTFEVINSRLSEKDSNEVLFPGFGKFIGNPENSRDSRRKYFFQPFAAEGEVSTNTKMKKIHFFVHIPKTAGTSFRTTLQEDNSVHMIFDYGSKSPETNKKLLEMEPSELTPENQIFVNKHNVLCGHVMYRRYAHCVPQNNVFSIVRNPVERIVSEYQHLKRNAGYPYSFDVFYKSDIQQNKQSKLLRGLEGSQDALVGLTSHYRYFLEMFSSRLNLKMDVKSANTAPTSDTEDRLKIPVGSIEEVYRINQRDMEMFFRLADRFIEAVKSFGYNTVPRDEGVWNCRIDQAKRVVGWIPRDQDDCFFVILKVNDERRAVIALDECRDDVFEKGLSKDPRCGFSYPLSLLGAKPGDRITVALSGSQHYKRNLDFSGVCSGS